MKKLGPGLVVTAAFIGPGTITTSSVAGARFGFDLLWALAFSVVATITLQEMAARLGLVTGEGLAEALRSTFKSRLFNVFSVILVVSSIAFGNAAFETGNIAGAAMGLELLGWGQRDMWAVLVGVGASGLLLLGGYAAVERILVGMVLAMSVVFLTTMILVGPAVTDIVSGLCLPKLPDGSTLTVVALIGTTVVPYNLFLHSSAVREKWPASVPLAQGLSEARWDTALSVSLGGLITLSVVTTAATAALGGARGVDSAAVMATQLEPLLGDFAGAFFAVGLFAAGMTSAITAPLAGAYATCGALGWKRNLTDHRFRAVWAVIILVGTVFAAVGKKPVAAIVFAQAANGILLPVTAVFLLINMNRSSLLGVYRNRLWGNLAGGGVVAVAAGLGMFQLLRVAGIVGD